MGPRRRRGGGVLMLIVTPIPPELKCTTGSESKVKVMPYFCTAGRAFSFSTSSLIMFFIAISKNDLSTMSPKSTGAGRDLGGLLASVSQEKGRSPQRVLFPPYSARC